MKGKPFLVAVAAFVIVLFGGVAVAGVGSITRDDGGETAAHIEVIDEDPVKDEPVAEPVKDEPKDEEPVKDEPKDEEPAKDEPKDEEPVKDEPKDKEPAKDEPKDEEPAKDEPKDKEPAKDEPKDKEPAKDEPKDEEPAKEAPKDLFSIATPKDGTHVEQKVVRFAGEAADGVVVHRGKYKAAENGGEWAMELVLSPGKNRVAFEAVHPSGATEVETVTVYYDAPKDEEKPKEDPPKDVKFSANQKYGSCGEGVPYDVFWGTAQPGAKIKVTSEYGSGSTKANEKGHWELKVKFPDSPPGQTFKVKVTSSAGGSKTFSFTNTQGDGKDH